MDRENGKHPAGGTPKKSRPKKPKKPSRLTRQQKLLIAVAVVLAIVLIAVVACQSLFVRPDLPDKNADADSGTQEEEIDWGEGTRPRSDGERKSQDYYTVLILGRDTGGGGNTDTMLLASYDVTNQKATVMSIPRDTMVNVSWDIKRINSVYNYYGGGDRGIQYLYKEIAQLVGFEPDYQVVVEWDAVGQIVDAMGGVWFDVPRNMNYDDPYQDLHIHQEKGYRLLTGDDAMQVLRYRHDNDMRYGYPDGDLGRIKTQQAFLTAMVDQLLQIKNVTKINQFIQVFQNNVETDLSFQNILWFAQQAILGGLSMENVEFVTMPNRTASCWSRTYHIPEQYLLLPDAEGERYTDIYKYNGDIFLSNLRMRLNHECKMTAGQICYIIGVEGIDTLSRHYCDYSNSLMQYAMVEMMNRWTPIFISAVILPSFTVSSHASIRNMLELEST